MPTKLKVTVVALVVAVTLHVIFTARFYHWPRVNGIASELQLYNTQRNAFDGECWQSDGLPATHVLDLCSSRSLCDVGLVELENLLPPTKWAAGFTSSNLSESDKFLSHFTHLVNLWGFNNKMFFLRENLFAAHTINRTLLLPAYIITHNRFACLNSSICSEFFQQEDERHRIPLGLFFNLRVLSQYNAVVAQLDKPGVYAPQYGVNHKWIDRIPPTKRYVDWCPGYLWFNMDNTYKMTVQKDPEGERKKLTGLLEEFGDVDSQGLDISEARVWGTQRSLKFSSRDAYEAHRRLSRAAFQPSDLIVALAARVYSSLNMRRSSMSMCVHWRRGDFVELDFDPITQKKKAEMLAKRQLEELLRGFEVCEQCGVKERILITNEADETLLDAIRGSGVLLTKDFLDAYDMKRFPPLAFGDFRGVVEQLICASATIFVGTSRSSMSGQILNLRGGSAYSRMLKRTGKSQQDWSSTCCGFRTLQYS